MSLHVIFASSSVGVTSTQPSTTVETFTSPTHIRRWVAAANNVPVPWCVAGDFKNWVIELRTAPGAGNSYRFRLVVNGSFTALDITIADAATSGSDLTNVVAIADGDTVAISCVPTSGPTATQLSWTLEFEPTTTGQYGYGAEAGGADSVATTSRYSGLFCPSDEWPNTTTGIPFGVTDVSAIDGSITKWGVRLNSALGAGNSRTYVILKNGVDQDGAGGTPDTRLSFGAADTSLSATFTLTVVAGDQVVARCDIGGAGVQKRVSVGMRWASTTPEHFNICGHEATELQTATVEYAHPTVDGTLTDEWRTTEADAEQQASPTTAVELGLMRVALDGAPGNGGDAYTFDVRVNQADSGGPSVAIVDAATTGVDSSGVATIGTSDSWNIRQTPSVSPTARRAIWALAMAAGTLGGDGERRGWAFIGPMLGPSFVG